MLKYLLLLSLLSSVVLAAQKNDMIVTAPVEKYFGDDDVRPSLFKVFASEIEAIEWYLNGFNSFAAQFRQSNKGEISYGKLFVSKPDKIRCEYLKPLPMLLIMNDKKITYYDQELDEVSYTNADINALKFLALSKVNFSRLNLVEIKKDKYFIDFTMREYSQELKQDFMLTLQFSYPKIELKQLSLIYEANEMKLIFDKISYNQAFSDKLFYFNRDLLRDRR